MGAPPRPLSGSTILLPAHLVSRSLGAVAQRQGIRLSLVRRADIVETVLLANSPEWMTDAFKSIEEVGSQDLVDRYTAQYG